MKRRREQQNSYYCAQAGLGEADLAKIEIVGPVLKDYIKPYKLPRNIDQ